MAKQIQVSKSFHALRVGADIPEAVLEEMEAEYRDLCRSFSLANSGSPSASTSVKRRLVSNSSRVRSWAFTPGTSSTQPIHHSPSRLTTAVRCPVGSYNAPIWPVIETGASCSYFQRCLSWRSCQISLINLPTISFAEKKRLLVDWPFLENSLIAVSGRCMMRLARILMFPFFLPASQLGSPYNELSATPGQL